jgi:hypothetical protein
MGDLRGSRSSNITMSYTSRKIRAQVALGDTWDTVKSMSGGVDPYLPEALCRIDQLRALTVDRTPLQALFGKGPTVPVPVCAMTAPGQKGIGVEKAIKPLRAAVFVDQHPIVVWLGLTAVLMVPFVAGYAVGRMKK